MAHTNPTKPTPIKGHVGPFKPSVKPVRRGLYKRVAPKTGTLMYAYFDPNTGDWGLASTNPKRALARKHKRSKKALPWYGMAKG